MRKAMLFSMIILVVTLGTGVSKAGAPQASLWDLSGIATAKVGKVSETVPVSGMLGFNADRTYVFQIDGEPLADTGVWFTDRRKLLLFTQNLLEQILALEADLQTIVGEPVEITPTKSKGKISINSKTGLLSVNQSTAFNAFFPNSNVKLRITLNLRMTGAEVP